MCTVVSFELYFEYILQTLFIFHKSWMKAEEEYLEISQSVDTENV